MFIISSYLDQINKPILMDATITGCHKEMVPNLPDKALIIDSVKQLSQKFGKKFVSVRYDPVFLNDRSTVDYHLRVFEKLCSQLDDYVEEMIISFLDGRIQKHEEERQPDWIPKDYRRRILTAGQRFSSFSKNSWNASLHLS